MRDPKNVGAAITALSIGFVVLGYALPFVYGTAVFAPYAAAVADWVSPGARVLDAASTTVLPFGLGILGGSIAGKWVLHGALAWFGIRRGQRWAYQASVVGLLAWFVVDSVASLLCGAVFNVLLINLLPLVLVGGLLLATDRRLLSDAAPPPLSPIALSLAGFGMLAGVGCAFLHGTFLFAPWWDTAGDELLRGPFEGPPRRLIAFLLGPIGGCIVAHFGMIGFAVWRGVAERWVAWAVAASLVVWFVFDSAFGLALGAYTNVLIVNLPSLVAMVPVVVLLHRRPSRRVANLA